MLRNYLKTLPSTKIVKTNFSSRNTGKGLYGYLTCIYLLNNDPVNIVSSTSYPGAPNENVVQNHLNIALLNVFYLNISLVSSKCLFEVWLFEKGGMDDKIAMIAMRMFQEKCSNF